jgi:hypothetical protein
MLGVLVPPVPVPKDGFIAQLEGVARRGGRTRWRSTDGKRIYEWDGLHGELEVYNDRGRHLGVLDPITGNQIKEAERGRKIDV